MTKLTIFRTNPYWNPMTIMVDGKGYALNNIVFYNKDGIVCQTNCGWFDDYNENKVELITSKDIKRCTKLNFTKGIPFIKKDIEHSYDSRYILYLPYDDFEWNISYIKQYDQIYKIYTMRGDVELRIKQSVKDFYSLLASIRIEYDKILDDLKFYAGKPPKDFNNLIDQLTVLHHNYNDTEDYVKNYSVEDYLNEVERNEQ